MVRGSRWAVCFGALVQRNGHRQIKKHPDNQYIFLKGISFLRRKGVQLLVYLKLLYNLILLCGVLWIRYQRVPCAYIHYCKNGLRYIHIYIIYQLLMLVEV